MKHLTKLKNGDKAPEFSGKDQEGKIVRFNDFKGKKIVLFFYPKDNTPGCTLQNCNLRDNYALLKKKGFEIIGVSADTEASHLKFSSRFKLPFPLIADVDHKVIKAYDVWGEKSLFGVKYAGLVRTTFVIDEKGIIELVLTKVKTAGHAEQILTELKIK
jgi:thioredoxin-dependent peroxiredoxin